MKKQICLVLCLSLAYSCIHKRVACTPENLTGAELSVDSIQFTAVHVTQPAQKGPVSRSFQALVDSSVMTLLRHEFSTQIPDFPMAELSAVTLYTHSDLQKISTDSLDDILIITLNRGKLYSRLYAKTDSNKFVEVPEFRCSGHFLRMNDLEVIATEIFGCSKWIFFHPYIPAKKDTKRRFRVFDKSIFYRPLKKYSSEGK